MTQSKVSGDPLSIEQLEAGLVVLDEGQIEGDVFWDEHIGAFRETVLVAIGETSLALMSSATPLRWRLLLEEQLEALKRYIELADRYITRRQLIRREALEPQLARQRIH